MRKILVLFGVVLISLCSCSTTKVVTKYVPVYKKYVNTCEKPKYDYVCDLLAPTDDFAKFGELDVCILHWKEYIRLLEAYVRCLEKSFEG